MTATGRPRDNRSDLVRVTVRGWVAPPRLHREVLQHDHEGRSVVLPGTGGVHPDVHAGDPVDAWLADHLMVGASIEDADATPAEPGALHLLACVGNEVRDAGGATLGVVAGKRGGLAPGFLPPHHVSVEAPGERLRTLVPGATVFVETLGRGLELADRPDIALLNCSPAVLDALPLRVTRAGLEVDVRLVVPSAAAGSGLGQDAWIGDLEIADAVVGSSQGALCFGDLVAFADVDASFGRSYRPGSVCMGLVAHGPSFAPGHGIGVTLLLSGSAQALRVRVSPGATLAPFLRAGAKA
jgi:Domain of unknown function (DUF4438), N-terminal/Domain of unknown function (DUF4438), C-terminal